MIKKISMEHGAGGYYSQELIKDIILKNISLRSSGLIGLDSLDDGSSIKINDRELIMTTDSHVIQPIFFDGGDIGKLSICGAINDLSVMGAKPLALSCSLVIPEGFNVDDLKKIIISMDNVLKEVNVPIITGDTKTIEAKNLSSIIINITGIGECKNPKRNSGLCVGDDIIITGDIADHGISLLIKRNGFNFNSNLISDVAPLWNMIKLILDFENEIKETVITSMKDPTRGGVASALNEMAENSNVGIIIKEEELPIKKQVIAACDMLGLDPLEIANEGKAIIGINPKYSKKVIEILKNTKYGKNAKIIGKVVDKYHKKVILESKFGTKRYIDTPIGDPIPRVC